MPRFLVVAVGREGVSPRQISPRLRSQLSYFMSAAGETGVPALGDDEYWFDAANVARWLADGVFHLVSPLDTAHMTEVELSEEQEDFLNWLMAAGVQHVRVVG
jgi:hypothetical protein